MVLDPRKTYVLRWYTRRVLRRVATPTVAYLIVDPRFGDVVDDVRRTTPFLLSDFPTDDEEKQAFLMLCAVIVGCIKNRQLRLIMDTPSRDGREAKNCEILMLSTEAGRWHC